MKSNTVKKAFKIKEPLARIKFVQSNWPKMAEELKNRKVKNPR